MILERWHKVRASQEEIVLRLKNNVNKRFCQKVTGSFSVHFKINEIGD